MSEELDHAAEPLQDSQAQIADDEALEQAGLTADELRLRREALAQLRQWGDPVLRSETRPVERFDEDFKADAERMIELMHQSFGIGLAAPQIGKSRRVFVYQVGDQPAIVLANPVVEYLSEDAESAQEGCLSLANIQVDVDRPIYARVTGLDVNGDEITIEASGLEARVIQHEFDHLNGVLILDRTSKDQRREALRALREAEERTGYAA
ncbi:MAG: peptide deformylase [Solirubrobacterales bacterium]